MEKEGRKKSCKREEETTSSAKDRNQGTTFQKDGDMEMPAGENHKRQERKRRESIPY